MPLKDYSVETRTAEAAAEGAAGLSASRPLAVDSEGFGSVDPRFHPRPSLMRSAWQTLDGPWAFARSLASSGAAPTLDSSIEVPFAPECPSSGIGEVTDERVCWYSRTLELPAAWRGKRIHLHFNAVDWQATVWLGGQLVADHEGGYSPFVVDVSELVQDGPVELLVRTIDDPLDMSKPRGKQDWRQEPHGIWYPRTSGIWQSVWWEALAEVHVQSLRFTSDMAAFALDLDATFSGLHGGVGVAAGYRCRVQLRLGERLIVDDDVALSGDRLRRRLHLPDPGIDDVRSEYLWTPERPNLFAVEITLVREAQVLDTVHAATALRTIGWNDDAMLLNGRPYKLRMALDQGYWPESHLTPPDSSALGRDVELAKSLGFNGVRKHQKLEDPRFYAWADRLGLLVWVELPSAYAFDDRAVSRSTKTWLAAIEQAAPHPSVVAWVPFNESWGVPDLPTSAAQRSFVRSLVELTRALDPSRPVVGNDGWEIVAGDLLNVHDYTPSAARLAELYGTPEALRETLSRHRPAGRRLLLDDTVLRDAPVLLTEFGGVRIDDGAAGWGYAAVPDSGAFAQRYAELLAVVDAAPLAGFCYTQLTDTFQERNGLLTMQREPKAALAELAAATRGDS